MVGVVGGDVGPGTYTGEVISVNTVGNITSIQALYHFNGSKHAFTADLNVTQDESAGTATITGYVTEGWLKGASVTGEYTVLAVCPLRHLITPMAPYVSRVRSMFRPRSRTMRAAAARRAARKRTSAAATIAAPITQSRVMRRNST